jgi:glycosyltransferase involved in cell wall biosynthesis
VKVTWLTYLDPFVFSGGGELHNRLLIEVGRERGHLITISPWLRERPQRAVRRIGLHRRLMVDWSADLFVLANIHNIPQRSDRIPGGILDRALEGGRAVLLADAWVDTCPFDMPCDGDRSRCRVDCRREWTNRAYAAAMAAVFVSPMQRRMIEAVLDVPLPPVIYSRPQFDTTVFRDNGAERTIDVLYVGTIERKKGYQNLLERFGPARMTFVGPNVLGEPVAGTYLGPIAHDRLPEIYNRARIFAHLPEWNEPMGRTVVEAALCGCEVVTNERVGVLSYDLAEWTDPAVVATNATRFWEDLEAEVARR